jgi:hypothetical protein
MISNCRIVRLRSAISLSAGLVNQSTRDLLDVDASIYALNGNPAPARYFDAQFSRSFRFAAGAWRRWTDATNDTDSGPAMADIGGETDEGRR